MTPPRLLHLLLASCTLFTAPGCPGNDPPTGETAAADSGSDDSSTGATTSGATTSGATTSGATTTGATTTDGMTTTVTDSTTGSATESDSSTTEDGSSDDGTTGVATGDDSSSSGGAQGSSGSTGETGVDEGAFYGDCSNFSEADACNLASGEVCIEGPAGIAVCAEENCVDAADCATPASGDAVVTCADFTDDGVLLCHLPCDGMTTCPDDMQCLVGICAWAPAPEGGGACPDTVLDADVPQSAMGTNAGTFDDVVPECGGFGGGEEALLEFTAPVGGSYAIDTAGSDFDTVLMVLDGCGGAHLACNDDGMGLGLQSAVTVDLAAGETIIIAIDGYDGEVGDFVLNIATQ